MWRHLLPQILPRQARCIKGTGNTLHIYSPAFIFLSVCLSCLNNTGKYCSWHGLMYPTISHSTSFRKAEIHHPSRFLKKVSYICLGFVTAMVQTFSTKVCPRILTTKVRSVKGYVAYQAMVDPHGAWNNATVNYIRPFIRLYHTWEYSSRFNSPSLFLL